MRIFKSLVLVVCLVVGSTVVASAGLYGPLYSGGRTYNVLYDRLCQLFEAPTYFSNYTHWLDTDWIPVESEGMVKWYLVLDTSN